MQKTVYKLSVWHKSWIAQNSNIYYLDYLCNKIPLQINAEPRGTGTDANAIQLCRSGVPTCLVSIPLRYMHSPCELVSLKDLNNCIKLISNTVEKVNSKTNFIPF